MTSHLFREHQYIVFDYSPNGKIGDPTSSYEEPNNYCLNHFSGQALGKVSLVDSDFSNYDLGRFTVGEVADSMGEWIAVGATVDSGSQEYVAFADAFGYGSIFYANVGKHRFVISDTFHGVAAALLEAGCTPTLNFANYLASLTSPLTYFQNSFSEQTMIEEINLLRPDQYIHISALTGVTFRSRSSLGSAGSLTDYDAAIGAGIELAQNVFKEISSQDSSNQRITLSGGVDSRIVLALLASSGEHKKYSVFSVDPRNWHNPNTRATIECDIQLADLIRREHKMSWWTPGERDAVAVDFSESLAAYQSHRSNLSYSFRPVEMLTFQRLLTTTLRGGGGEILSSTAGGLRLDSLYRESSPEIDPSEWFSRHMTKSSRLTPVYKALVRDYVRDVYEGFESGNMRETYENWYFNTRNRAHFGHLMYSLSTNELSIQMLSNAFFLRASELASFDEKAEGKLVKDIFARTHPDLLNYRFESEDWTRRLVRSPEPHGARKNRWTGSYDRVQKKAGGIHYVKGRSPKSYDGSAGMDKTRAGFNYLKSLFYLLEEAVQDREAHALREQHSLILSRIEDGKFDLFRTLAKAASAIDGFAPQPVRGTKLVRYCRDTANPGPSKISPVIVNRSYFQSGEMYDIPVFDQRPILTYSRSSFKVESNFTALNGSAFQFAFYLLKDGKRVTQRWYENTPSVIFQNEFWLGRIPRRRPRTL